MARFAVEFVVFFAVMALSTLPLAHVAKLSKRRHKRRKWLRSAAFVALVVAALGWSSRDLQEGCRAERNEGCIDVGGAGSQLLLVATFVLFALAAAYMMYND